MMLPVETFLQKLMLLFLRAQQHCFETSRVNKIAAMLLAATTTAAFLATDIGIVVV
jgi:hypothetical protein